MTNAKPGHSWHNFKVAWDVVPAIAGKPVWDKKSPLWQEVIALGKQAGAEAGADWIKFRDMPHFQIRPLTTLKYSAGVPIDLKLAAARWEANKTIFV